MRVWVARPEREGARTAAALSARGHEALRAPVLEVRPTGAPVPAGPFDGLILTSANALPSLPAPLFSGLPVFAVGARTAQRAEAAGLGPVVAGPGDGQELAALVAGLLPSGVHLLHAAGAERKAEPARTLRAAGFRLTHFVAYSAEPVAVLPPEAEQALAAGALDVALHYSRRSAALALVLTEAAGLGGAFRGLGHYCLSADVAAALEAEGVSVRFVAARPREADLLDGLDGAAGGTSG